MTKTAAQQRIWDKVKSDPVWFGARSAMAIEALEKAGLVKSEVHVQADACRGRHKLRYLVWRA